jgi:hypothetical protein
MIRIFIYFHSINRYINVERLLRTHFLNLLLTRNKSRRTVGATQ